MPPLKCLDRSARLGLAFAVVGIATLIGTPISGGLLTDEALWWRPIIFAGVSAGLMSFGIDDLD
jgi:hypothetical protein